MVSFEGRTFGLKVFGRRSREEDYCLEAQPTRKKPCLIHTKAIPQRLYLELKGQTQQPGRNPMNHGPRQSAQRSPRRSRPGKLRICAPSSTRQPSSELARPARSRSRTSRRPIAPGRPGTSTGHSPTLLGSSTPGLSRDGFRHRLRHRRERPLLRQPRNRRHRPRRVRRRDHPRAGQSSQTGTIGTFHPR